MNLITCPFCIRISGTCCRCKSTRKVEFSFGLLENIWDVQGCNCDTCKTLRKQRPFERDKEDD